MFCGDGEQRAHVLIVEPVVDVTTIAPVANDPSGAQEPKGLRHLGLGGIDGVGDLVYTEFVRRSEGLQDTNPGRITEQTEQCGGLISEGLRL